MTAASTPGRKGFVLIATSVALVILLGLAVFGIDLGRMYMIKSEMQAFADSAALAAALEVDGTDAGLERARASAGKLASGPNAMRWDMGARPITDISVGFAKGDQAPDPKTWQTAPGEAADFRFVRVTASAEAPLIFLRAFQPFHPGASTVAAAGVARKTAGSARLVE